MSTTAIPTPSTRAETPASTQPTDWWRSAVIYQIYPRSFADGNGDGIGDFLGMIDKLEYLSTLGVDAVWVSPFYVSPQRDAGYDVANYTEVDPRFGELADFDRFLARAHELGIRVIIDLVPNHSSDQHEWFQAALAAGPGSPERERFMFRPGAGPHQELPPNNWKSVFGGGAWEPVGDGDWYLHIFDSSQPDWNWENPEVRDYFDEVLRFWLDRGVDGFRVDVAHALIKAAGLPDNTIERDIATAGGDKGPMWDQDRVHEIYQHWREVLDSYTDSPRIMCAEAWVSPAERMARYVRPDEMHQSFNFPFMLAGWQPERVREIIDESLSANNAVGATTTWVLSNHDVVRHASRLGLEPGSWPAGISADQPQPDAALGLARARALTLFSLALPGSMYLYQGEELGLPEHTTLSDEWRQDPSFHRTGGTETGRDGCRIPLPWDASLPANGFNTSGELWLPQPESYAALAAATQLNDPGSTWSFYHEALQLRHELGLGTLPLSWHSGENLAVLDASVGPVRVLINMGDSPAVLPEGEVLLGSDEAAVVANALQPNRAVWLRVE